MATIDHAAPLTGREFDTDLDHHSPEFREHNYELMAELRERCPVAHSSAWDGFWMFTDYESCLDALYDPGLFSNDLRKSVPTAGNTFPLIPIDIDPPQLQQYRRIVLPWFSPNATKRMEREIRQLAAEMIDEFIETGEADLSQQLFTPLPARVILRVLGFDDSRWPDWVGWVHNIVHDRASAPEKALAALTNVVTEVDAEVTARRDKPRDDLMTVLMTTPVAGQEMTADQLQGFVLLLMLGGMDTTSGLTGNTFVRLEHDRGLRQRLIDDPGLLQDATEEFLRHDTPSQGLARYVTRDATFHGRQLRAGDRVLLMYASANRDPKMFDHPDDIDLMRPHYRHMAFALGVHRCLGSNLARAMFQSMVSDVLSRLPDYRIRGAVVRYPDAGDVYGVRELPVSFTPGPRVTS